MVPSQHWHIYEVVKMQREKNSLFSALAYLIEDTMPGRFVSINVRKCV